MASKSPPQSSLLAFGFQRGPSTKNGPKNAEAVPNDTAESHGDEAEVRSTDKTIEDPVPHEVESETTVIPEIKPGSPTLSSSSHQTLTLDLHIGDMFAAPPNTVLIHACNTQGSWGAGIAAAFRIKYPEAYKVYRSHCLRSREPQRALTSTCLLIPPCETRPGARKHWIACLFTSARYGKAKDKPDVILQNTGPSMRDLLEQIKRQEAAGKVIAGLRMCKINSAKFGVPWHRTVNVLESIDVKGSERNTVEVWAREED
ncbi:hypothetical protein BU24DRAFT_428218 [Aaosphaeria arxii CBS 175.79]|uniref:ADP-ribose 1''-phosphate phosphatase n=1 Tax=Aaosphaeria arxii CBS 175.79 TaxID=1450172 RepID=A0A6A5XAV1_9PLEO|nr:uncharacterized protein BU24DRAFT_428218 [Aaosphaeria arxii CBS 175.79]KAF2010205.1 hypothetical protein BU24DRAFT_428218 [Aaosphaeria arxii CBS 175.79]